MEVFHIIFHNFLPAIYQDKYKKDKEQYNVGRKMQDSFKTVKRNVSWIRIEETGSGRCGLRQVA